MGLLLFYIKMPKLRDTDASCKVRAGKEHNHSLNSDSTPAVCFQVLPLPVLIIGKPSIQLSHGLNGREVKTWYPGDSYCNTPWAKDPLSTKQFHSGLHGKDWHIVCQLISLMLLFPCWKPYFHSPALHLDQYWPAAKWTVLSRSPFKIFQVTKAKSNWNVNFFQLYKFWAYGDVSVQWILTGGS